MQVSELTEFQIRLLRERLTLTRVEAAALTGRSYQWVALLETGGPTADESRWEHAKALLALATERGVPVHDITEGAK